MSVESRPGTAMKIEHIFSFTCLRAWRLQDFTQVRVWFEGNLGVWSIVALLSNLLMVRPLVFN